MEKSHLNIILRQDIFQKKLHLREDVRGEEWQLFYLRNKDKKEEFYLNDTV